MKRESISYYFKYILLSIFKSLVVSFKLRLHTAINRADFACWCMLYTYEVNKIQSWENDAVLFVGEALNYIHKDTELARLIAVCKCSFRCFCLLVEVRFWILFKLINSVHK